MGEPRAWRDLTPDQQRECAERGFAEIGDVAMAKALEKHGAALVEAVDRTEIYDAAAKSTTAAGAFSASEVKLTDPWCSGCGDQVADRLLDARGRCAACRPEDEGRTIPGTVRVVASDLAAQTRDLEHLRAQVTELQAANTRLVEERRRAPNLRRDVRRFMEAAGQACLDTPRVPCDDVVRLRLRLVMEEAFELMRACVGEPIAGPGETEGPLDAIDGFLEAEDNTMAWIAHGPIEVDIVEAADALGDLAYVVEGTCLAMGIDSGPLGAEVTRSNMTKDFSNVSAGGKVKKGDAFVLPAIGLVLREQGWRP